MKFLKQLKNFELYRHLRIFRNISDALQLEAPKNVEDILAYREKVWQTLVKAPDISIKLLSADYDCRVPPDAKDQSHKNIFIHLKVRLSNLGGEETIMQDTFLKTSWGGEKLKPLIFKNDGGALTYVSVSYTTPLSPGVVEEMPLNFFFQSKKDLTKDLKGTLTLRFQRCRPKKIEVKIPRLRRM